MVLKLLRCIRGAVLLLLLLLLLGCTKGAMQRLGSVVGCHGLAGVHGRHGLAGVMGWLTSWVSWCCGLPNIMGWLVPWVG